jgi:hypothetical protein
MYKFLASRENNVNSHGRMLDKSPGASVEEKRTGVDSEGQEQSRASVEPVESPDDLAYPELWDAEYEVSCLAFPGCPPEFPDTRVQSVRTSRHKQNADS